MRSTKAQLLTERIPPGGGARIIPLMLPAEAVSVRPSGIEFQTPEPLPLWTEARIEVCFGSGGEDGVVMHGVVVDCSGDVAFGCRVAILFVGMDRIAETRVRELCSAQQC